MTWALIGGSGFEKFEDFKVIETLDRQTPFGTASSGLKRVEVDGHDFIFLPRHGEHHDLTPTEVNYRANIFVLKKYGARKILSVSAVGSLRKELAPGDCVIPKQYIDRTKGTRKHTYCGEGLVGHVSLAKPTCVAATASLRSFKSKNFDFKLHFDKTYVCMEGPAFSTGAESHDYRAMNADIIGMTNFPEYALAREAGLCYVPLSFVTDYDCWDESVPHVTLDEVLRVMRMNNAKGFELVRTILDTYSTNSTNSCNCAQSGLKTGLMTPREAWPSNKYAWLEIIISD